MGVDLPRYKIGDVHSVERGNVENVTVYNGDQSNTISFIISFTGAMRVVA